MPIGIGVATLGSALLGGIGQLLSNRQQVDLSRDQMDFQERMSNTSYQRGVKDMMAAGLNPMLAYSQGGASAPIGSMPQVQNVVGAGIASGAQAANTIGALQQVERSQADIDLVKAQAKRTESETLDNSTHSAYMAAQIDKLRGEKGLLDESTLRAAEETLRSYYGRLSERDTYEEAKKYGAFEADARARGYKSKMLGLDITRAEAEEELYRKTGGAPPAIRLILDILRGIGRR